MLASVKYHIPEWFTGLSGVAFIAVSLWSSVRHRRHRRVICLTLPNPEDLMTTSKRATLFFFGLLAAALLLLAAYVWTMLHLSYSDGERAGYLQSFPAVAGCARPGKAKSC
jgi:hypothetical protein